MRGKLECLVGYIYRIVNTSTGIYFAATVIELAGSLHRDKLDNLCDNDIEFMSFNIIVDVEWCPDVHVCTYPDAHVCICISTVYIGHTFGIKNQNRLYTDYRLGCCHKKRKHAALDDVGRLPRRWQVPMRALA